MGADVQDDDIPGISLTKLGSSGSTPKRHSDREERISRKERLNWYSDPGYPLIFLLIASLCRDSVMYSRYSVRLGMIDT
jgi:hypothetical protein